MLRFSEFSRLSGSNLTLGSQKVVDGSTNCMVTIPTEMTSVPTPNPATLSIVVNNVPGSCNSSSSTSQCSFAYDSSLTPVLTSVAPSVLDFAGSTSLTLTLAGTFPSFTSSS